MEYTIKSKELLLKTIELLAMPHFVLLDNNKKNLGPFLSAEKISKARNAMNIYAFALDTING